MVNGLAPMGTYIINDRYEVLSQLGRGGMGVVFRANQRSLNRIVAIKMLSRELAADEEFRQRFQQEAQVIARLQHENIVTVYDIEADRGTFFIIMEYVEGVSLQELLKTGGRLPPERGARLVAQVARALGYAHNKGIIHRDIKPDNIMVVGNDHKAMVMDFGIARVADSTLKTQTGISMGTPKYMSPEQARGQRVDARSDLYSLGVVLYACATGELPFDGDSPFTVALKHMQEPPPPPREKVPDLPEALEQIILHSLAKERDGRFQSGEEFAAALETIYMQPTMIPGLARGDTPTIMHPKAVTQAMEPSSLDSRSEGAVLPSASSVMTMTPLASWKPKKQQKMNPIWIGAAVVLVIVSVAFFVIYKSGGAAKKSVANTTVAAVVAPAPKIAPTRAPAPVATTIVQTPAPQPQRPPLSGEEAFDSIGQIMEAYRGKTNFDPKFAEEQRAKLVPAIRTFAHLREREQANPAMGILANKIGKRIAELYKQLPPEQAKELFKGTDEMAPEAQSVWRAFRARELTGGRATPAPNLLPGPRMRPPR